jgi:hypothetical protein
MENTLVMTSSSPNNKKLSLNHSEQETFLSDSSFEEYPNFDHQNHMNMFDNQFNLNHVVDENNNVIILDKNYELHKYFMNMAILYSKKRKNVKHQVCQIQ